MIGTSAPKKDVSIAKNLSAMLCLYRNNVAAEVREALESAFIFQTLVPSELIVVFDGPVPSEVTSVIEEFENVVSIKRIIFDENLGHGPARAAAIDSCTSDWIAIIDADDISLPNRFETLMSKALAHPECAVIGAGYTEFHMENGQVVYGSSLMLPNTPADVTRYVSSRAPVAQATAILRREAVLDVGNYQTWFNNEDYHLWIRIISGGYAIRNVDEVLLLVRTDLNFYGRRGGVKYWWNEVALQRYSLTQGTTTISRFIFGVSVRFVVQVLLPTRLRSLVYQKALRR